ncbi:PaaI family thioesterase [Falsiroseomonas tokyonensis]|uniref:PaaI family thioesterase n=1 Tax=Falsiroseomonas tokyonensis TaxID=430521 RepID=A0ABV7BNX0_9PROT|nr:PaaI family thioesterase [Falsiroseomonas tokyonensis]MBU8536360.1 PaaI family thioesterase [Falsiroseomonas tokyonensis]
MDSTAYDPATDGWQIVTPSGLPETANPLWQRGAEYGFAARPDHANGRGVIHGGILATFMDHTLGLIVRAATGGGINLATIQLDLHYLAAAKPGQFLVGAGEITRQTRSVVFVRGTLRAGDTAVIAATGIWKLLAPPR